MWALGVRYGAQGCLGRAGKVSWQQQTLLLWLLVVGRLTLRVADWKSQTTAVVSEGARGHLCLLRRGLMVPHPGPNQWAILLLSKGQRIKLEKQTRRLSPCSVISLCVFIWRSAAQAHNLARCVSVLFHQSPRCARSPLCSLCPAPPAQTTSLSSRCLASIFSSCPPTHRHLFAFIFPLYTLWVPDLICGGQAS